MTEQYSEIFSQWEEPDYINIDSNLDSAKLYSEVFSIFSILAYIETCSSDGTAKQIGIATGIPINEVKRLLEAMKQMGIIRISNKRVIATGEKYTLGDKDIQPKLRNMTETSLALVHSFINTVPDEFRFNRSDLSIMFIPIEVSKIPEAKKRIQRFRRSLAKFMDSGKTDEAYILAVNLVPISGWRNQVR